MTIQCSTGLRAVLVFAGWFATATAAGADLSASEIMQRSFDVYGGEDSISTLTFTFETGDEAQRKLVYTMAWKKYAGKHNVNAKFLFIKEFPTSGRGTAYMAWRYRPYADRDDEEWIYLPELRTVRQLSHHRGAIEEDEEFAATELKPFDLDPRHPSRDTHELIGTEEIDGVTHYVVESERRDQAEFYPYSKVVRWISADEFLTRRIHYSDLQGQPLKRQTIEWQKVGDAWVWKTLDVTNVQTGDATRLEVSDVRINVGLDDNVFSKRTMRTGLHGRI